MEKYLIMSSPQRPELQVAEIVIAAVADEATDEQLQQLNTLISEEPGLADFVVDLMSQESWLSWHSTRSRNGGVRAELVEQIARAAGISADGPLTLLENCRLPWDGIATDSDCSLETESSWRDVAPRTLQYFAAVAATLVVVGAAVGFGLARWQGAAETAAKRQPDNPTLPVVDNSNYKARFVQGTACLWDQNTSMSLSSHSALRTGESLNLLEGLAELRLEWADGGAELRIEGPAGLVLTAERGASLSHGRCTVDVHALDGQFTLATPSGQVEVSGSASIGVAIAGGNVELHVFQGSAQFLGAWTRGSNNVGPIDVASGEAIRIVSDDGRIRLYEDIASSSLFASKLSMGSDNLVVTPEYVQEVVNAKPVIYWRFEDDSPHVISNEMGSRYQARLTGVADLVQQAGNSSLELGAGLTDEALSSYVYCDEPLDQDFSAGYSLEAWVKPSHYHWGSVVGFLGEPTHPGWNATHGLLLEVGGPRSSPTEIEHPGRLRYLHRSPPGEDIASGTSCFSEKVYELRKWQHVVAVKTKSKLQLYVNGEPVAAEREDSTSLVPGMKVIIGQLDRERFYRKFVGQIDEIAIYPRPLSSEDIIKHFKLVRPTWNRINLPPEPNQTAEAVLLNIDRG